METFLLLRIFSGDELYGTSFQSYIVFYKTLFDTFFLDKSALNNISFKSLESQLSYRHHSTGQNRVSTCLQRLLLYSVQSTDLGKFLIFEILIFYSWPLKFSGGNEMGCGG